MKEGYMEEIWLEAPKPEESKNCRERIFTLIDQMVIAKNKANDKNELETTRDSAIHEINYLARRLLWEV